MGVELDASYIPKCIQTLNNTENLLLELVKCLNGTNPNDYCKYLPSESNQDSKTSNEIQTSNYSSMGPSPKTTSTTRITTKTKKTSKTIEQTTSTTKTTSSAVVQSFSTRLVSFLSSRSSSTSATTIPNGPNAAKTAKEISSIRQIIDSSTSSLLSSSIKFQIQESNTSNKLEVKIDKISSVLFVLAIVSTVLVVLNCVGFGGFVYLILKSWKCESVGEKNGEASRNVKLENGNANFAFSSTYL